jgi:hypothetical protein
VRRKIEGVLLFEFFPAWIDQFEFNGMFLTISGKFADES